MSGRHLLALVTLALSAPLTAQQAPHAHTISSPAATAFAPNDAPAASANDNRVSAGRLSSGVYTLKLEAREARWFPEDPAGRSATVFAFAEAGKAPSIPGPFVRVPAGTQMKISVRNTLAVPLRFRGFQDHATELDTVVIAPGQSEEFQFRADVPGSYLYYARTEALPAIREPGVRRGDAMLAGAFIVDPVGTSPRKNERVMVISIFSDSIPALGLKSDAADKVLRRELVPQPNWFIAAINGKAWPYTERLTYNLGDSVHWRIINASALPHPMHLHGFYFDIDARGDESRDTLYTSAQRRQAVTEWMVPGSTMAMTWVPTRAGNWVFHCHLTTHISETLRFGALPASKMGHASHVEQSMSGLVVAMQVTPSRTPSAPREAVPRRKLRLFVTERPNVFGTEPGLSYVLQEGPTAPAADSILQPSSTLVLRKDEPTEISVINRSSQMATIHWHGVELESFYDGVGDWSGWGTRVAPVIAPGDSFAVRLTPQRAGTFIYHSHSNEAMQLPSGLYGTLIVLPANGNRDTTERVFLLGIGGPHEDAKPVINGSSNPPPVELRAGTAHRFRLINISPLESHTVQLVSGDSIQMWRPLAKDGADLPASQTSVQRASIFIHPGETYDFEVLRQKPESLAIRIFSPNTIAVRLAARARGVERAALPRYTTLIPVNVH